jgi:hypothetical protein
LHAKVDGGGVAGTAVELGRLVVGGGEADRQEDERVLQVLAYPLMGLGERSINGQLRQPALDRLHRHMVVPPLGAVVSGWLDRVVMIAR